jgi:hypothetical protein
MNFTLGIVIILRLRKLGLIEISHQGISGIIFLLDQISLFVWRSISMKINRPMNVFEKLEAGRYWFWECLLEWIWCMTHPEDTGGDFFCHICSDYVKYEESEYYEKT